MAMYGSPSVVITMDDASGTPRIITPYVTSIGEFGIEQITEQTNPFGATAEAHTPVGIAKSMDIPISGFFDDTATVGPHVVFKTPSPLPSTASRTLVVATGGGTFTIEGHPISYKVAPKNGGLTPYTAVFRTTALGVWS